ncbi:HAD-IB family phosphatase [Sphingomonas colocasiae]|uniref:HAD-IB family phosphatase n=1 Tax=Sphingomonas colocasiae TaxID=1848973 RepID=A0ABS7PUA2_9SPHN|nr:HAD-IB family phosphatase [Sphingomonas colocasiae]
MDRTLTRLPTYSAFLLFAARRARPWRLGLIPLIAPWAVAYAFGLISRKRMKEVMHGHMLGHGLPRATAERLAGLFADRIFASGLYDEGGARIRADHEAGRRVILATAAPSLYIDRLAAHLSVDDVVATGGTWLDDRLTSRIAGENCYGAAKQRMIADHLARRGITRGDAHIRFYSDHASDLPSFEWADEPVAVNPSPKLRRIAAERGWPILDWAAGGDTGANRAITTGRR